MSIIKQDFGKLSGGETLVETLLWQNPSPSTTVSSGILTLSDDYTKYDLIKIVFKCNASGADDSKRYIRNVYQTPEDIQNTQNEVNYACAGLGRRGSSTSICDFIGLGTADTNVNYYHLDTANLIIPLSIYGVRYADNPILVEDTLWEETSTSSQAAKNVTLSSSMDNYKYLKFYTKTLNVSGGVPEVVESIIEVSNFKNCTAVANSKPYYVVGAYVGASLSSARRVKYIDNTTIALDTSYVFNSNSGAQPTHNVVLKIAGIKQKEQSVTVPDIVSANTTATLGATTTYTVPKKGEVIIEFSNGSNNAPTVTIDGVSVLPRGSYIYAGKYNWQYVEMVTAGQVVVATMGTGSGRDGSLTMVNFE